MICSHALIGLFKRFSCMTKGTQIRLPYMHYNLDFDVLEVQPGDAVCIIETNVEVDFAPMPGYEEELAKTKAAAAVVSSNGKNSASSSPAIIPSASPATSVLGTSLVPSFALPPSATSTGSDGAVAASSGLSMKQLNEQRLKRKFDKDPKVVAFAGTGHRVDGKKSVEGMSAALLLICIHC